MARIFLAFKEETGADWIYKSLLLLIGLCPLPLGSVYQWSISGIGVVVAVLLIAWAVGVALRGNQAPWFTGNLWLSASLYAGVMAWVAVQGSHLSPQAAHPPTWTGVTEALQAEPFGTISLDPFDTYSGLLQLTAYAGIFWLSIQYGRDRKRARIGIWTVAIVGLVYALYGLIEGPSGQVLWFSSTAGGGGVRSTFINRNLYAAYAGIGFLCLSGLLLEKVLSVMKTSDAGSRALAELPKVELSWILLLVAMALVLVGAISLTLSRAGVVAAAASFGVLFFWLVWRKLQTRRWSRTRLLYATAAATLVIFGVLGTELGARLERNIPDAMRRVDGYELIISAAQDAPLTGLGYGAFRDIFFHYNDGTFWKTFNYSHNLYLGAMVELGIPAALALIGSVGAVGIACVRGAARRRRDYMLPAVGVAIIALVAIHGLVDSPLLMPANAATFSFVLGIAYAQSRSSRAPSASHLGPRRPGLPKSLDASPRATGVVDGSRHAR